MMRNDILRKETTPITYIVFVFFFSLLFIANNKLYVLVYLIFGLVLFFIYRVSLIKTLFVTLLLSLPFERGLRGWMIEVAPRGVEYWMPGYSFYFGFSLKLIFIVSLLLLFLFSRKKAFPIRKTDASWLVVGFFLLSLISTIFAESFYLSLLGVVRIASFVGLYLVSRHLFADKNLRLYLRNIIVIFLLFFGFVGTLQFVNRQPLGLFLEDLGTTGPFGFITTDGEGLYRVSGLSGHPTFFGSFLSLLIPVGAGFIAKSLEQKRAGGWRFFVLLAALLLGGIALFATFSRSGWIALVVGLLFFLYRFQKTSKKILDLKLIAPVILGLGLFITILGPLFFTRLHSFADIRNIGNARGRINLARQSLLMVKKFPVFGVGLNHFTKIMERQDLSLEARTFLYPVHNTFLLFFSEIGIPAGILFLGFVLISLYKTWRIAKKSWINFGIWVGAFSFLINAQFHTLFSLDPTLDLFMVMLAYLWLL